MHLAATRVGELLRGEGLPVDEEQAGSLLSALGATGGEIRQGIRLYRAARAGRDQETRAAASGTPGWWLRSGYARLVGDIAPLQLLGREEELEELARWCASSDEAYVRWQAGPRAGKSALMSWFVLHPPPGTWVISFFVTARLAAQADSTAFTDGLLDQLAAATGEQFMPVASGAMQDRMRRQLLELAAERAVKAGRQLVLVVDGIDEDCGSLTGSGLPSIAACLPKRPPKGLRVIVAGRPDPPLPVDVDPDHPLHRCQVRLLNVSPYATRATELAQQELDEILAADKRRHDGLGFQVLGLVTASGGGLGDRDLQQLTGRPAFEVDRLLHGVFGRTITTQVGPHAAAARVFLFTHETLREQALERLGPDTLAGFTARLHAWADSYRHLRWPADTPDYLLRGYPRMLAGTGNVGRLATLAADPARHHRMLDATGGDTAALAEIAAAHALISTSPSPDLLAALRLARYRDQLADQNTHIPAQLPAVWVTVGRPIRAEGLARSITDPAARVRALTGVISAMAGAGNYDHARELAADAERIARSITNPYVQSRALADVVSAMGRVGDYDHAEEIARSITDPDARVRALAGMVSVVAGAGDYDRARELAAEAERIAPSIIDSNAHARALAEVVKAVAGAGDYDRAERIARSTTDLDGQLLALAEVVSAVARAGDYDRAGELGAEAEQTASMFAKIFTNRYTLAPALPELARAVTEAGDFDRAERIAQSITHPDEQVRALTGVVLAVAGAGDFDRAERIARSIRFSSHRVRALAELGSVAAGAGNYERAEKLTADAEQAALADPFARAHALDGVATAVAQAGDFDRAERIARSITDPDPLAHALTGVVLAVAGAGDFDRAERIARSITDPNAQAQVMVEVATVAASVGYYGRARELAADAERIARSITDPGKQARVLVEVATAVAGAGDNSRARELAAEAERTASSITDSFAQSHALAGVATAVARAGDFDRAERIARSITDSDAPARALAGVATAVGGAGDYGRARELAADAERIASSITAPGAHARAQAEVVTAVVGAGDFDRAERIARSITDPVTQGRALAEVVSTLASVGDYGHARELAADAERIARSITDPVTQGRALAEVVSTLASVGDYGRARQLAADAERIAQSITDPGERVRALAEVVTVAAGAGDYARARELAADAEQTASSITDSFAQAQALAGVATAVAGAGEFERAERIARSITDSYAQALALAGVASSVADPVSARSCIAGALAVEPWTISLKALTLVDPVALSAFAAELTAPTRPSWTQDNGRLSGIRSPMHSSDLRISVWPCATQTIYPAYG